MSENVRVLQYGLGPIGCAAARHIVEREGLSLVGGVDIDPSKIGRDLGEIIGLDKLQKSTVHGSLAEALDAAPVDVALHTTSSYFARFFPQVIELVQAGLDVVSTAEELSFPWLAHPEQAAELDAIAKRAGKTVLATGVNPGFLMDTLPLVLTAICQQVEHIEVRRVINASTRRGPFQTKIGAGLSVAEFETRMAAGRMGHVGLIQSAGMVLNTLGKTMSRFETGVNPVVAEQPTETAYVRVAAGEVLGLRQEARAYTAEGEFLRLVFVAALDADGEQDTITIQGKPSLKVTLEGTNGDLATVAMVVNAIRRVREAAPGLVTMRDLPPVTW